MCGALVGCGAVVRCVGQSERGAGLAVGDCAELRGRGERGTSLRRWDDASSLTAAPWGCMGVDAVVPPRCGGRSGSGRELG